MKTLEVVPSFMRQLLRMASIVIKHRVLISCVCLCFVLLNWPKVVVAQTSYTESNSNITVYLGDQFELRYSSGARINSYYTVTSNQWTYKYSYFQCMTSENSWKATFRADQVCSNEIIKYKMSYKEGYWNTRNSTVGYRYYYPEVSWNVTVIPRPNPEGICLNDTIIDMPLGIQYQLKASVLPEDAIQTILWHSSDTTIATVSDAGLVTGMDYGDAVVTAISSVDSTIVKSCNVHIGKTDVQKIDVQETMTLTIGDKTQLKPSFIPDYAIYELDWLTDNNRVVSVDQSGNITANMPGETDVTVKDNLTGNSAKCHVVVQSFIEQDGFIFNIKTLTNGNFELGVGANSTPYYGSITIPKDAKHNGVTLPITYIDCNAFVGCNELDSVYIPTSITNIKANAFAECGALKKIKVESATPFDIDEYAFSANVLASTTLQVPIGYINIYKRTNVWEQFQHITDGFEEGATFTANIVQNSSSTVKAQFMLIDKENNIVEIGNGTDVSIPYRTTGTIIIPTEVVGPGNISYHVSGIAAKAFYGCYLTYIEIPQSITCIGQSAFASSSLNSITFADNITNIGEKAFSGCLSLNEIVAEYEEPFDISDDVFDATTYAYTILKVPAGSVDAYKRAKGWKNFQKIEEVIDYSILPDEFVTDGIKYRVEWLDDGTATATVVQNGNEKYKGNIVVPEVVRYDKRIPLCVTAVDGYAFYRCSELISVSLPTSVVTIGSSAFESCNKLTKVEMSDNVKAIDSGAFEYCSKLESITLPAGLTEIAANLFMGCSALKEVVIPSHVTQIGEWAFVGCNLEQVLLPDGLAVIGNAAFGDCESLMEIEIPASVTSIGEQAFAYCPNLAYVTVHMTTPLKIDETVFENRANATLYVPEGCVGAYRNTDYWKEFKTILEIGTLEDTDISELDNVVYVENRNIYADGLNPIYLKMKNSVEISAVEFDLELPDGMSFNSIVILPDRVESRSDYKADTIVSDKKVHIMIYPIKASSFSGNEGNVARIKIETDMDLEIGDYPIILKNIKLADKEGETMTYPLLKSTIRVIDGLLGDANNNHDVEIGDIVSIINYLSKHPSNKFQKDAADVNGDGEISISDIVGVVNTIVRNAKRQR